MSADALLIADAWRFVHSAIVDSDLRTGAAERYVGLWARFERFAVRSRGITLMRDIDRQLIEAFVGAHTLNNRVPAPSTMRTRRAALRYLFFKVELFGFDVDVRVVNVPVPQPEPSGPRWLTAAESERCRWAATGTVVATRYPLILGFAESGVATGEIGWIRGREVDLAAGTVAVPATLKGFARTIPLTDWAVEQLQLADRRGLLHPDGFVAVERDSSHDVRRTSVTAVLTEILERGGLRGQPGIEPRSFAATAGRRILQNSARIDFVALALGLDSLDRAAVLIGFDWRAARAAT
jgi:integrase/recombinase XerC